MVAVGDDALDGVEEAVDVDDRPRVSELRLEVTEPPLPVLIGDPHVGVAQTETAAERGAKLYYF